VFSYVDFSFSVDCPVLIFVDFGSLNFAFHFYNIVDIYMSMIPTMLHQPLKFITLFLFELCFSLLCLMFVLRFHGYICIDPFFYYFIIF